MTKIVTLIENHWYYIGCTLLAWIVSFNIGLLLGWMWIKVLL